MSLSGAAIAGYVLYVDDNPDDRVLLQQASLLSDSRLLFFCLDNFQSAMAYLKAEGVFADRAQFPLPVFLLLDYALGLYTGADILHWVRAHPTLQSLPALIYSDSDSPERLTRCQREGANAYLVKCTSLIGLTRMLRAFEACFESNPPAYHVLRELPEYRPFYAEPTFER